VLLVVFAEALVLFFLSPSFSSVPLLVSLSIYSLSNPLFIFLRPCSLRRNKENSFYSGSSSLPVFCRSWLFICLSLSAPRFCPSLFFCGLSFSGFCSQRTIPFHPLIAGVMVAVGGWTVEEDEQCLETAPFLVFNGYFYFGPFRFKSFVIKPLV